VESVTRPQGARSTIAPVGWRGRLATRIRRNRGRLLIVIPLLSTILLSQRGIIVGGAQSSPGPQVGFTFRPYAALALGLDPDAALATLLTEIQPDVVRLPVYWSDVATAPDVLDFTIPDRFVRIVAAHDAHRGVRRTTIVLVVGMRNVGAPELYAPTWALKAVGGKYAPALGALPGFEAYVDATVKRYAGNPLLQRWQVENEPLDDSVPASEGNTALTIAQMRAEIARVRTSDGSHPIMTTTFTSTALDLDREEIAEAEDGIPPPAGPQPGGHPEETMTLGDTLGLDFYIVYAGVNLNDVDTATRIIWKRNGLSFWVQRAAQHNRDVWIAEMQAAPWQRVDGFGIGDLLLSAREYREQGESTALLWGVEQWLTSPTWMAAGKDAVGILRGG
jgi:hypothetical protein